MLARNQPAGASPRFPRNVNGPMAIPEEKSIAVQLVPTVAAGVAAPLAVRAVWNGVAAGEPPRALLTVIGVAVAAAFFCLYGWMQRRQLLKGSQAVRGRASTRDPANRSLPPRTDDVT
jgi:hypothetical protein